MSNLQLEPRPLRWRSLFGTICRLSLIILCLLAGLETLIAIKRFSSYRSGEAISTQSVEAKVIAGTDLMSGGWQFDGFPFDVSVHQQQPVLQTPALPPAPSNRLPTDFDHLLVQYVGLLEPKVEERGAFRIWNVESIAMQVTFVTSESNGQTIIESLTGWLNAGAGQYYSLNSFDGMSTYPSAKPKMLDVLTDANLIASRLSPDGRVLGGIYEAPQNVEQILKKCKIAGYKTWHQPGIIPNGKRVYMIAKDDRATAIFSLNSPALNSNVFMLVDAAGLETSLEKSTPTATSR